ncbi:MULTISPECIES: hypothetical protein [unclassified Pseudonocardia]|uniref:hypothetical protein n=1 Tax=unclassified Pseudonocardia TaxID=2619320 RepID=UPI0001FFDF63|nr:hypothetical protein [Pseudonocardia sp. Ae707_Ps1]OLM17561.1 hypothetical protein Ae707Ps1_1820 [Pseudonocardia sp. Ae707_Ps1]
MAPRRPVPPPGGDWRRRMAVRGGRVSHTLASHGWLVFLLVGVAVGLVVGVAMGVSELGAYPMSELIGRTIGGAIAGVVFCAAPSVLFVGLPAQYLARSYLRSASPDERRAMQQAAENAPDALPAGLVAGSRWARAYEGCVGSVTAFHGIVRTVPDGPAKDWLHDIGRRLDTELAEALRTARLGESVESGAPGGDVARSVGARLEVARTAFHDTTEHAASIALDLRADSGFEDVRAQLDQLTAQAPHLRRQT